MAIDPSIYRGVDTQFGLKLADLLNPASVRQRQMAEQEQTMGNQLRQMQVLQGVEQMRRAPVLARREEMQYQAQQSEALRKQEEQARRQAIIAQLPEEQRRMLDLGVSPEKVLIPKPMEAPKTREVKIGGKILTQEWTGDKWQDIGTSPQFAPTKGTEGRPIYDTASNEWVYPPSAEAPQGRRTGDVAKLNAVTAAKTIIDEFKVGTTGAEKSGVLYTAPSGGMLGLKGTIGRVTDTQKAREFDNLRESLSTQMRAIFRIPGEGALSDKEQAQYGLQLPDVKNDPDVNERILSRLEKTLEIRASTTPIQPTKPNAGDDEALAWARANPNDPRAAKIMAIHGR